VILPSRGSVNRRHHTHSVFFSKEKAHGQHTIACVASHSRDGFQLSFHISIGWAKWAGSEPSANGCGSILARLAGSHVVLIRTVCRHRLAKVLACPRAAACLGEVERGKLQ
jgi:hypothetical protein